MSGLSGTIMLSSMLSINTGQFGNNKVLTIAGPGAANLTITAASNTVSLLIDIYNGDVTFSDVTFSNPFGSGVTADFATLTTHNVTFTNISGTGANVADGNGTINDSTFTNNGTGMVIARYVNINGSTFSNNVTGLLITQGASVIIKRSTFASNTGNGITANVEGFVDITDSTLYNNGGDGIQVQDDATANLSFVTAANNTLSGLSGTSINIGNSLLANNAAGNCATTLSGGSGNVSDDATCPAAFAVGTGLLTGGLSGTAPQTVQSSSIAVDHISSCTDTPAENGNPRPNPTSGNCDAGAYQH